MTVVISIVAPAESARTAFPAPSDAACTGWAHARVAEVAIDALAIGAWIRRALVVVTLAAVAVVADRAGAVVVVDPILARAAVETGRRCAFVDVQIAIVAGESRDAGAKIEWINDGFVQIHALPTIATRAAIT